MLELFIQELSYPDSSGVRKEPVSCCSPVTHNLVEEVVHFRYSSIKCLVRPVDMNWSLSFQFFDLNNLDGDKIHMVEMRLISYPSSAFSDSVLLKCIFLFFS